MALANSQTTGTTIVDETTTNPSYTETTSPNENNTLISNTTDIFAETTPDENATAITTSGMLLHSFLELNLPSFDTSFNCDYRNSNKYFQ